MRQSQSAVLERGCVLGPEHLTEPFEVGWASEARWFVQFLEGASTVRASLQVQVSPDGINWVDHESPAIKAAASGSVTIPVESFGLWLRLKATRVSGEEHVRLRIYLTLKE